MKKFLFVLLIAFIIASIQIRQNDEVDEDDEYSQRNELIRWNELIYSLSNEVINLYNYMHQNLYWSNFRKKIDRGKQRALEYCLEISSINEAETCNKLVEKAYGFFHPKK